MPRFRPWWLSALFLGGALAGIAPALAADEAEFKPLFNGKDLSGWVTPADKSLFVVEEGEIVGRTKTKTDLQKNEFLVSDQPYGDFILTAKFKFKSGNSGIQIRSDRADDGRVSGPQADIGEGYWGSLYEENRRGMLDAYPREKGEALLRAGEWNTLVVQAEGDHVKVTMNGVTTVDRVDPKLPRTGIIALQIHAGRINDIRFKDVMIKKLDK